ncbi:hypothetical protein [Ornithinibacillus halotolerans]|uniref:Uncharacterized protein n=1 Tax=Ornithinibacillus halotolerans TaxID=1274357 RepID=A0A916W4G6_9BACI|nr:hypothetical protein [Ornithinibacillus halotolerans]GGA65192.1 hypothetical protein GCM10008025_06310 [Ornithinibacillus halotolerans]
MYRISIAPLENIVEVAKENSKGIGENLDFFTNIYEAGMKNVLRQIAYRTLLNCEIDGSFNTETKEYKEVEKEVYLNFNLIQEQMQNNNNLSLLSDLEAGFNSLEGISSQEHFIQGFIEGYKFTKEF